MKTILYCASTTGHLRSFHVPYLTALLAAGHRVTTAASGMPEGLPDGVSHLDLPFTKRFLSPRNLRASMLVAHRLRRERFDLILTHTSLAAFFVRLGVMLAGKGNTRVVNTVHGYLFSENNSLPRRMILLGAEKLTASVTDDILVMNTEDESIARRHRLCRGRVLRVDGMGVPMERLRPPTPQERAEARSALRLPDDALVLVYAAEFSRRKNQRFLIENLSALPENVLLLLPGRGDAFDECRALAEDLGLSGRVILPGFAADTRACLWAADVCVSSSRSEGLPFHVMESMACGLPSLLSRVKGHTDLAGDGPSGLLYALNSPEEFRAAACRLANDPALRLTLGENAQRASLRYGLDRVLPQVLPLYQ